MNDDSGAADGLLSEIDERQAANHQSVGNAVASIRQLTLCLRRAWEERTAQVESKITGHTSLVRVLLGSAFSQLANPADDETRVELATPAGIISGYIDRLVNDIPAEIKVTWAFPKVGDPQPQYLQQLAGYIVALGRGLTGILYVLHVAARPSPILKAYQVRLTRSEAKAWKDELSYRASMITAVEAPPPTPAWSWECKLCPYYGVECPGGTGSNEPFFDLVRGS